jgi:signal transduction histidine kinase/CheY-like chemotaxis protein
MPRARGSALADAHPTRSALEQRIAQEHLRLSRGQIARIPLPYFLIDAFLCWMLSRLDLLGPGLIWVGLVFSVEIFRWSYVRRLQEGPPLDPHKPLQRLSSMLLLLGVLRGAMLPMLFSHPVQSEHYLITMVYVGLIAGTSASVGGQLRPFVSYALLAGGSLALAWALQGTVDGIWVGVLIVCLIAVLTGNVRDQCTGLEQFVKLAWDNEVLADSLRASRDVAEAASRSKTKFFAAASHDLRQPLHALSINATTLELLAMRQSDPLIKEISHSINRALNQGNGLLDSLLDLSNLDAGAVKPKFRRVVLGTVLDDVREEFAALAAHKGLALRLELPAGELAARTDPTLLRRILINLVGNAMKFTRTGSVTLTAGPADARKPRGDLMVAVTDTGIGITPADQIRVFEEFYQVDNSSRDRSLGLGLGLPIVKRTAALLGADLNLQSTPGSGTRVTLTLEQFAGESDESTLPRPDEAVGTAAPLGLNVMVIDDETEILDSMQGLLEQLGCTVRCATNGEQASAALADGFKPHVLLIDHRLRSETGSDVIARLRERFGPLPAVLVTGDTEPSIIQTALLAGHRVIHKPVQGYYLAQVLREVVETSR